MGVLRVIFIERQLKSSRKGGKPVEKEMLQMFYQRYSREIYLYLYLLCKSHETAGDLMQEVFLKALLSFEEGNLRAWLYKVARNTCFNHLRQRKRETHLDDAQKLESGHSPIESYLQDEQNRILYQGMMTLPRRQREILELYYFSEMSFKEIAVLLQLTPENVRVLAHRGKKALKMYMEVNGYDV